MDSEPQRGAPFFGESAFDDLAGVLQVGKGAATAQVIRRSARQIARGDADYFRVTVLTSGRSLISQDGREAVLGPGDFALLGRMRPYQQTFDGDFSQIMLMMRRDLLLSRIGAAELFTAMRIDGAAKFGGLLSPMLQQLPSCMAAMPDDARGRIAENVLDLVATALLVHDERAQISAGMTLARAQILDRDPFGPRLVRRADRRRMRRDRASSQSAVRAREHLAHALCLGTPLGALSPRFDRPDDGASRSRRDRDCGGL